MATDAPQAPDTAVPAAEGKVAGPPKDRFFLKVGVIALLMAMAIGGEFLVLMKVFGTQPAPTDTEGEIPDTPALGDPTNPSGANLKEVEIDSFSCTNGVASQGHAVHVSFRLVVTVAESMSEHFSVAANSTNRHRVREAVQTVARSASLEDLRDATQNRLKRQIKEDINKILGNSYISEVIISDFKLMEQ